MAEGGRQRGGSRGPLKEAIIETWDASGRRSRDGRVAAFAREAGFELALCRPRTPQTKGKDESANRFLSRLRAYE